MQNAIVTLLHLIDGYRLPATGYSFCISLTATG